VTERAAMRAGALLFLCLTGCSNLFQSKAKPEQTYYLRAPAAAVAAAAATPMSATLRVMRPITDPGLDNAHIILVQADHRMNFYSGSRWAAPAPELIEALAVQTLRGSGDWASVEGSASPFPSDYMLQVRVRRFEADYAQADTAPVVRVVLDCILGRRPGREVLATFTVSGDATSSANHLSQVVAAFEQATATALEGLARQTAQAARADLERAAQNEDKGSASSHR
jgi:cholesterol transport system auxiliary component